MAYTTVADVQSEFKSITFSAQSAVTDTDVTEFITQEEALLNGRVGKRYATPIAGNTQAVSLMKMIATLLVKARVLDILAVKTGNDKPDQGSRGGKERERAENMVQQILDGELQLPGQTPAESGAGVIGWTAASRVDDNGNSVTQTFERDTVQW